MNLKSVTIMIIALTVPASLGGCAEANSAASQANLAVAASAEGLSGADIAAATVLSPAELDTLYANRSWMWSSGAGLFSSRNHRFIAWSRTDGIGSYAEGKWFATPTGQLCMEAVWHAQGGSAADRTCFDHRKVGTAIYQRKAPAGNWYLFRGPDRKNPGEYAKFAKGDQVSRQYEQVRREIVAKRQRRK